MSSERKVAMAGSLDYADTICCNCGKKNHPYMVTDKLWKQVAKLGERFLSLLCFEDRISRPLREQDFNGAPINYGIFGFNCLQWEYLGRNQPWFK